MDLVPAVHSVWSCGAYMISKISDNQPIPQSSLFSIFFGGNTLLLRSKTGNGHGRATASHTVTMAKYLEQERQRPENES
jgi:hypothetical protein